MSSFQKQVQAQTRLVRRRMKAVRDQSTLDVVNRAQRKRTEGGRMRVDTGFLRSSGKARANQMPSGDNVNPGDETFKWDDEQLSRVLVENGLGNVIFFGWTANYARPREYEDSFLRLAVQKWGRIVDKNAKRAQRLIR